jgi:hypothetical protein
MNWGICSISVTPVTAIGSGTPNGSPSNTVTRPVVERVWLAARLGKSRDVTAVSEADAPRRSARRSPLAACSWYDVRPQFGEIAP